MTLLLVALALIAASAIIPPLLPRAPAQRTAYLALLIGGCGLTAVAAIDALAAGTVVQRAWTSFVPGGDWVIGIDPLSAIFLIVIAVLGATNGVYGDADMRNDAHARRTTESNAFYAVLVASLVLVVAARNIVLFLAAWEVMAISSFLLVMTYHERAEVRRAGWIYAVATHTATLILMVMFALWSGAARDWSFTSLAAAAGAHAVSVGLLLLLALTGFGLKAGYVPLHFWLPPAHAASPSHVSALMSGIVIEMGIYGLLRVLTLLGAPPAWWAWLVFALGAASALLGVLWALAQRDIKRLLAYSSVEHIGIIVLAIGLGALGQAYHHPALAVLGYAAAVLHTVNHALFKSLLFMTAGTVYARTHTRNIEELGGLARRMPWTFLLFAIGAVAVIGVPPLNGFVSEWLVFLGLFDGARAMSDVRLVIFAAPVLALAGGLALACFANVTGIVFLGSPRSERTGRATEVGSSSLVPQAALALCCAAIGVAPALVAGVIAHAGAFLAGDPRWASASAAAPIGTLRGLTVFSIGLIAAVAVLAVARFALGRRHALRRGPTWACGYDAPTPRMQYTSSSFAAPLVTVFGALSGVRTHRGATVFHSEPRDIVLDDVLTRVWGRIQAAALRLRPIQQGRLHVYLVYVAAALLSGLTYFIIAR
ncbi:MAG TPA: proton-conducting transporter membrane subunit [Gemmatimonadaceae bacterium]